MTFKGLKSRFVLLISVLLVISIGTGIGVVDSASDLLWTVVGNQLEKAELLIKNGANVNEKGEFGFSPLHIAAMFGYKEMTLMLMDKGADVNDARSYQKRTPLHWASACARSEIVEMLINRGAKVNVVDLRHYTMLHLIASGPGLMYDAFSIIYVPIPEGKPFPFLEAVHDKLLGEKASDKFYANFYENYASTIGLLLSKGIDINAKGDTGVTPLHLASFEWEERIVRLFIKKGADINVKDERGDTPLHYMLGSRSGAFAEKKKNT
ncbi:MAG: ankyrin repeat protein [uncultured bacterium]|nr:MAG: ankyrin repeat protein [uncultured bacterium]